MELLATAPVTNNWMAEIDRSILNDNRDDNSPADVYLREAYREMYREMPLTDHALEARVDNEWRRLGPLRPLPPLAPRRPQYVPPSINERLAMTVYDAAHIHVGFGLLVNQYIHASLPGPIEPDSMYMNEELFNYIRDLIITQPHYYGTVNAVDDVKFINSVLRLSYEIPVDEIIIYHTIEANRPHSIRLINCHTPLSA